tara:strand:- start:145 stop:339 length:195 start_codon:yes stop_codon:yes gene_type:complete
MFNLLLVVLLNLIILFPDLEKVISLEVVVQEMKAPDPLLYLQVESVAVELVLITVELRLLLKQV